MSTNKRNTKRGGARQGAGRKPLPYKVITVHTHGIPESKAGVFRDFAKSLRDKLRRDVKSGEKYSIPIPEAENQED